MALKLTDKKSIVTEVKNVAKEAQSLVVADYKGMTSGKMTELRAKARKSRVNLRVIRNTLAKRALKETSFACVEEALIGPTILAFSLSEPGSSARLIRDFITDNENLKVKVLAINGKLLGSDQLNVVADLPTLDEAIAKLLMVMNAPVTKLVQTLAAPNAKLVRTLVAIKDKKQAEGA